MIESSKMDIYLVFILNKDPSLDRKNRFINWLKI